MKYWTTQTGEKLRPKDMSSSHILNSIRMLERFLDTRPSEGFYTGLSEYGDDFVEMENRHNEVVAEEVTSWIKFFKKELNQRTEGGKLL